MLCPPRPRQCRFLEGDRPDWDWCPNDAAAGRTYCPDHEALCHRKPGATDDAVYHRRPGIPVDEQQREATA